MTQFVTAPDGVRIAYEIAGRGEPVVLVHGFASDRVQNWRGPGWYQTLNDAGYRVVALDCRGHGESDKPHDPAMYGHDIMARDVIAVMDAAGLAAPFVMGYSMGGFIAIHVLLSHPARLGKLAIGGVGGNYLSGSSMGDPMRGEVIAAALLEPDKSKIADPVARRFRAFADQEGKDRVALAACMRRKRRVFTPAELAGSERPVLVVCGENDDLTGPAEALAAAFADGRAVTVPGRDHMTTVGDKLYKQAVLAFLKPAGL